MKVKKITVFVLVLLQIFSSVFFIIPQKAYAATTRVDLLTADGFAVLGGSAISDVPASVITGNVGLWPGGGSSITGLTCSEITGTLYDRDGGYAGGGSCRVTDNALLVTAKDDLTTAYNDAAGRTITSTIATDLAGITLTDGVYHAASGTFSITGGGTLTLDGEGNADSVFIFKMDSTLVTSSSSKVVLTNGAQECNVYWLVGSSTTLGTSSTLIGNVLALTSITDDGSSTVNGRLLARNGAVTLNKTTVTKKVCATPTSSSTSSSTSSTNSNLAPYEICPTIPAQIISPNIIESKRIDTDSISITWGPYSGTDKFNVRYGPTNGNWLYNVDVTGFSTTINALPTNQPIWVQVAARNDCMIATYGEAKLVGGPGLPNTGSVPNGSNVLLYFLASVVAVTSILFVSIRKK